jgi:hypothetical protein
MKKIVFKYTVKITKNSEPETHYAFAYTEIFAREGLASKLNINAIKLRLSKKNLPYKIRKAIFDEHNKNYTLTVDIKKKPQIEKTIEERQSKLFDLKSSILKSIKYKVKALLKHDKEILLEYTKFDKDILEKFSGYEENEIVDKFTYGYDSYYKAYIDLRETIVREGFQDKKFEDKINYPLLYNFYILDILDSAMHSIDYTKEGYNKMKNKKHA